MDNLPAQSDTNLSQNVKPGWEGLLTPTIVMLLITGTIALVIWWLVREFEREA